jgi:hypothetical protein
MAAVVWFTIAVALWHFTVFLPDRFWAGIVGALLGVTDLVTVLVAIPGTLIGVAIIYAIGVRREHLAGIE